MQEQHAGHDLLVVGSANADLVIRVERRPAPGETVLGSDLAVHPGGKGGNQAVAAARLGARTALLARVGDDAHGRLLLDAQRAAGTDTTGVLVGGAPTGVALITVDTSGDNSIVVSPGANARLTPADVRASEALIAGARVVSTQLEIPLETVAELVRTLPADGRLVLNPSPPAPLPADVLAACDPLVVNEHEARFILGDEAGEAPEQWARGLLALGPRSVVITLGAAGALVAGPPDEDGDGDGYRVGNGYGDGDGYMDGDGYRVGNGNGDLVRVASPRVEAVDTTGAGDAFTAALAWRLGLGEGLVEAARYAVRVGAAAVTRPGAQESYPTAEEVAAP